MQRCCVWGKKVFKPEVELVSIGISEFSFGFAFLYEQTVGNLGELKAAPVLPSLYEEGRSGWDAKLPRRGADFYFQFKLTDYLYRSNAAYIRNGLYDDAYFRIALHPRNNNRQHCRLKVMAEEFPNTFYVAPEFRSPGEFNQLFMSGEITSRSRLIPVEDCREISDGAQHYITFQEGNPNWIEHSEKQFHEDSILGAQIVHHYREVNFRPIDHVFARGILLKLRSVIAAVHQVEVAKDHDDEASELYGGLPSGTLMEYDPLDELPSETIYRAGQLSAFLGATMVIVGEA